MSAYVGREFFAMTFGTPLREAYMPVIRFSSSRLLSEIKASIWESPCSSSRSWSVPSPRMMSAFGNCSLRDRAFAESISKIDIWMPTGMIIRAR